MNINKLAFQNVKGNWRSYKMFFLSSCFSVFAFYMYTSIMFHPQMSPEGMYSGITGGLYLCSLFILQFSIVFILYASSIFIQARKKEFGLYILMGATKQNIIIMMMLEQMIMGLGATFVGIGIGTMFLKVFFMIFSLLLNMSTQMPFIFSVKAVLITIGIYGVLFSLLSIYNARTIWKFEIIHLLQGVEKGKKEPKSNRWLAVLGVLCVGIGYALTKQTTMNYLIIYFPLVVSLTTIGTYFVCKHGAIGILYKIKKWKKIMYQYPYLFVVNQLLYRVKDNRRFFFVLAMTTTFVVTATGTVYLYISGVKEELRYNTPHAFSYIEMGGSAEGIIKKEKVEQIFQKHGMNDYRYSTFTGLSANVQLEKEKQVTIISTEDYNREARYQGKKQLYIEEGSVTYVYSSRYVEQPEYNSSHVFVEIPRDKREFVYNGSFEEDLFNSDLQGKAGDFFVVHEKDFQKLTMKLHDYEQYKYYGYELTSWDNTEELARELMEHFGTVKLVNNNMFSYKLVHDGGILVLFVGSFISVLFFLASCSVIYFKWFNNIEYDRKQYQALSKVGMTKREVHKVLRWQLATPFFFPIILGCIHSGVALNTFTHVFWEVALIGEIIAILIIYVIACVIYFLFAQREYMKHIG
jgi:putative ABC transport system permease protein